jgi:phenylacetate-CoA ligase
MSIGQTIYRSSPPLVQTALLNIYAMGIWRHRYGARYKRAAAQMLERERWPMDSLREYQNERLRSIVQIAYDRSAYYRRLMDERNINPKSFRGIEDLPRLPILHKATVRDRQTELMTRQRPVRGWLHGHTSGTTGSPLGLWYDRDTCVVNNAADRRQKVWGGMSDDAWIGMFLGRVIVPIEQQGPPYWRANRVLRQVWFSSFHLSDETLGQYIREIERRGLRFLEGYPSTLYIVAHYLRRRGRTLPMHAVFTSSETLLRVQRDVIQQAFECPVFDFYGLAERVIFAGECEAHAGKHVADDFGFVEIVDDNGVPKPTGEAGYLVGTSLHNVAMPMLRYRTSDISAFVAGPCPCGRTLRRVRDITTKAEDIVVTPSGRMVSPSILTHPFKPLESIMKSQIVQEDLDRILVKVVAGDDFGATEESQLVTALRERLGPEMSVKVERVDALPPEPSGKFRWVVSRVPHSARVSWDVES